MSALPWYPYILGTRAVCLIFISIGSRDAVSLRPFGDVYSLVFNPHCIVLFFLLSCDSFPFIQMLVCLSMFPLAAVAVADSAVICSFFKLLLFLSEAIPRCDELLTCIFSDIFLLLPVNALTWALLHSFDLIYLLWLFLFGLCRCRLQSIALF